MMEEGRGTLDLVPIPATKGVVCLGLGEPGGLVGEVDGEGHFWLESKVLASN